MHTIHDIDQMPYDGLCHLLAEHPRLQTKFLDLIRDEHRDGNLTDADLASSWNGDWDDCANLSEREVDNDCKGKLTNG